MRLCMANGKRAIFHRWDQQSKVIEPSPLRNGPAGGIIRCNVGIVEFEDGSVASVPEKSIAFFDTEKIIIKLEREYSKWQDKSGDLD